MTKFHTAAVAIGQIWPIAFWKVVDFIDKISILIFDPDKLATIPQTTPPISNNWNITMGGGETLFVSGDDQISTGSDSSIIWEVKADSIADFPSA